MKTFLIVATLLGTVSTASADGVDVFRSALHAFQTNGAEALVRTLYDARDSAKAEALRVRLERASVGLGEVMETEVFAPKSIGKHVQRIYGVIYFAEHPLWVRAEYYAINGRSGFLSMEFSQVADEILPLEIGVARP